MAELYSQPKGSLFADQRSGGVAYTGDAEVDSYLNELPEEERKKELERYNAPLTGEEVAQALMRSTTYAPTVKEYKAYKEYQATKSTDIFDGISMAAGTVVEDLARGLQGAGQDPSKVPASVVEAFAQGTRNLYGMIAQSQDPDSLIFKWKDALSNTYSDEGYRQFLEARQFNRHSVDLMEGKTTLLVDKDLVNHDVVQAASYIADPTLFIPFGGVAGKAASLIGMGERLAAVTARASIIKNMVYAGALKYGAGVPLEFIGGATRRVIDKGIAAGSSVFETATGIAAKDAANYVRTAGFGTSVSGIAGYPIPYASAISDAYLKASVASGLGESLTAVADQMLKSQGRRGYMSFAEAAIRQSDDMLAKGGQGLSPHARKLLNVLDKADPMFAYAMEGLEGAAMGAGIGGGLGYLTGGEEGLAGGIGSGAVLGGVGGMAGRVVSDVAGASLKAERKVQADIALELMKDADPAKFAELSRMRAVAEANGDNIDGYIAGLDIVSPKSRWSSGDATKHEAYLEGRGQDPKTFDGYERNSDGSYKLDKDGKKIKLLDEEGFTVPTMEQFNAGAGWTMTRNVDGAVKVHINTTNYNPNTVPHELFHAIFREEAMKPEFKNRMTRALLGTYDESGKMVAPPTVNMKETRAFFESYIRAENKGNDSVIADRLSLLDKALTEYYKDGTMSVMSEDGKNPYLSKLTEEFGAYYFTQFIKGKRPDFLFRGGQYSGMRNLIETVKTGWLDYMERKITSVNPSFDFNRPDQTINPAFYDAKGKRVRVSALDHLMTDIVKATAQTNRNGGFDFRTLSPEGQEAYVKANGLSRTYRKRANGTYERMPKPEQAAYDKARGVEIFKAIGGLSPDLLKVTDANGVVTHELIPVRDAKGNIVHYEGTLPPAVLDHLQRTGYLDAPEKLRIQQLQDIVAGRIKSNIIEFIYLGREEGVAMGADVRVSGDAVATKARVAMVLAMNNKIKANGEHSFTALTLDWRNVKMRGEKLWADPAVRKMWNDDQTAFQGDLFRYLENASQPDGKRLPSAQLWQTDGEAKRNIMHQFAGIQRTGVVDGKTGTYFNSPNKEIVNDITASLTSFRTDGMSNITLTGDTVKFNPEGVKPIAMNFMPSEMSNERTPTGNIRQTKDGWKFIEAADGVKVYRADGTEVGKWKTLDEATAGAEKAYQKENPNGKPIPSLDNIRKEPFDPAESQQAYIDRKIAELKKSKDPVVIKEIFRKDALEEVNGDAEFLNNLEKWYKNGGIVDTGMLQWTDDFRNFVSGDSAFARSESYAPDRFKKASRALDSMLKADELLGSPDANKIGGELNYQIENFGRSYFSKEYTAQQPPAFVSGLSVALDKILPANVNKEGTIQASRLINLMKSASGGDIGKILTEANAIGFTDWLKSKGQARVSEDAIRQYIEEKGIKVNIDPRTDIRANEWQGGFDSSRYVAEGKKEGYYTFVARINEKQAHGVEGHYGKDAIVHIRATIRTDAQGRKVLFIEEIQSINTNADIVVGQKRIDIEAQINNLKPLHKSLTDLYNKQSDIIKNAINQTTTNKDYEESAGYLLYEYGAIAENIPFEIKKLTVSQQKELFNYYELAKKLIEQNGEKIKDIPVSISLSNVDLINNLTRQISERESLLAKKKSDKPLQDFNETVKIASRTIMRKAVELGAERVALVRPEDMHPDVSKNAEGERFVDAAYGKDIPMMINAELKKYGQELAPARNYTEQDNANGLYLIKPDKRFTYSILSESLGYDITPEMKQRAGRSQTFMMPSEGSDIIYTGRRFVGKVNGGVWTTKDFKRLENAGGIKAYRISPDARVLVLHKTKFDKNGNYLYSDINKSGFNELRRIALEAGQDLDFWSSKEQLFSNPELLEGDSLFPSLDTNETMRMSENELADKNAEFPEQDTRNSINKRDLFQAVKDAGYDIIKTTNIEGEATLVLNENAITPLTIDDKLPIHYMPAEGEYRSGDNYWKAKDNPFERVDEDGRTYRLSMALIGEKRVFNPDPENIQWMDIGHSNQRMPNQKVYEAGNLRNKPATSPDDYMAKMRDGLWAINSKKPNDVLMYKPPANAQPRLEKITHDEWLAQFRDNAGAYGIKGNITTGRYEKPIYKDGKLIEKGRLSMQAYGEITTLEQAKKIKEQVATKLGFKSEDFDAYVFDNKVKEQLGRSPKDHFPVKFMPAEGEQGGRKYTDRELERKFIGKYAEENPDLADNLRLEYKENFSYGEEESEIGYGQKIIQLKRMGEVVGQIKFNLEDDRFFLSNDENIRGKFVKDISVKVNPEYRGQGYQHLLYSEMFERARDLGAIAFRQEVENSQGLPLKSTNKIVGKDKSVIWTLNSPEFLEPTQENFNKTMKNAPILGSRSGFSDVPAVSQFGILDPNARYMPAEGEYRGGDDYYKQNTNPFETKDDQGMRLRKTVIGNGIGKDKFNPEGITYLEIGHGNTPWGVYKPKTIKIEGKSYSVDSKMWFISKDNFTYVDLTTENTGIKHSDKAKEFGIKSKLHPLGWNYPDALQGRIEMPVYKKGKLIKKGIASVIDISRENLESTKDVIEVKNKLANELNIKESDFDLYLFDASNKIKAQKGFSSKDQLPIKFMPAEQAEAWRKFESERVSDGNSIFKNAMNFVIIQANNKFKVYNPQKALLGIYTDLEEAKKRVRREEPKPR